MVLWIILHKFHYLFLCRFRTNLLAATQSSVWHCSEISKFLLQIMTLVSSANVIGSDHTESVQFWNIFYAHSSSLY
jgi:hypothetical protein